MAMLPPWFIAMFREELTGVDWSKPIPFAFHSSVLGKKIAVNLIRTEVHHKHGSDWVIKAKSQKGNDLLFAEENYRGGAL